MQTPILMFSALVFSFFLMLWAMEKGGLRRWFRAGVILVMTLAWIAWVFITH